MFIVLDGPDGTGKSTLAKALVSALPGAIYTAEPTDSPTGRHIRALLKDADNHQTAMLPLFLQDRQEHIRDMILPCYRRGETVVCDRYKYSTVCYQWLQGAKLRTLVQSNKGFLSPDITFLLYTSNTDLLLERIGTRGQTRDTFESSRSLKAVCRLYRRMPMLFPEEKFVFLPAERSTDEMLKQCLDALAPLLHK